MSRTSSERPSFSTRPPVLLLAVITAIVASAAEAAAQPAPANVLHACYVPKTGSVYRIKVPNTPAQCDTKKGHVEFSWNEQGPQGAAGAAGPLSGYAIVTAMGPSAGFQLPSYAEAVCPTGTRVIGGGFQTMTSQAGTPGHRTEIRPDISAPLGIYDLASWREGWAARIVNYTEGGYEAVVQAVAICAHVQ
jgi:hypothetical protein